MCNLKKWLEEWLNPKELNKVRIGWARFYFYIGTILLILICSPYIAVIIQWVSINWFEPLWVISWSSIGIGAWLVNSRETGHKENGRDKQHMHYVFYFGFALGRNSNGTLNHGLSALIGLTMGFASERLNELGPLKK